MFLLALLCLLIIANVLDFEAEQRANASHFVQQRGVLDESDPCGRHVCVHHEVIGKPVAIKGMEYVEVRDGKIVVDNLYYDFMSAVAQLGLIPEGAAA